MEIDIRIVATRRPDLLERTLDSMLHVGLKRFKVAAVVMNLDPAFGGFEEDRAAGEILLSLFPDATIYRPQQPGFGAAVKRLWQLPGSRPFFHLEDDWIAREPFGVERVAEAFETGHAAVTPLSAEQKAPAGAQYSTRRLRHRIFGIPYRTEIVTRLGTSPKFLSAPFAAACAHVMDPALDPEKQMRPKRNPALAQIIAKERNLFIRATDGGPLIVDIGRQWRDKRKIRKIVQNDVSIWENS